MILNVTSTSVNFTWKSPVGRYDNIDFICNPNNPEQFSRQCTYSKYKTNGECDNLTPGAAYQLEMYTSSTSPANGITLYSVSVCVAFQLCMSYNLIDFFQPF